MPAHSSHWPAPVGWSPAAERTSHEPPFSFGSFSDIFGPPVIRDVHVKKLVVHHDDRGTLMEVLRDDDPFFEAIAQTTFTVAYPGVIKAFHWHRRQKDVWFFASGMA